MILKYYCSNFSVINFQSIEGVILFYHHWGYISIHCPLSNLLRFLKTNPLTYTKLFSMKGHDCVWIFDCYSIHIRSDTLGIKGFVIGKKIKAYPYIKVTGCLCVSVCAKDLAKARPIWFSFTVKLVISIFTIAISNTGFQNYFYFHLHFFIFWIEENIINW